MLMKFIALWDVSLTTKSFDIRMGVFVQISRDAL